MYRDKTFAIDLANIIRRNSDGRPSSISQGAQTHRTNLTVKSALCEKRAQENFWYEHPVDNKIAVPHYIGWFCMQIRLLFLFVPRAPPPSSGVHCMCRGPVESRAHEMPCIEARTCEHVAVATSILIIIYAVARGSDIIIVRTRADSIDEDYAGYSPCGTNRCRAPTSSREH